MITGSADQNDLVKSMRVGATDFMHKPYSPLELVARVSAAASHKRLLDQLDSAESLLFALARMVEAKDENTGDHCSRLAHGSVVFGTALGLNEEQLLALRRGGVLHDIGKLGIPDSILLKNGPLTDEEWVLMRQHTVIGARLCSGLNSMKLTVPIIRHHHERWDGSGYPDGLKGEEIPYLARIFQIVDVYDALASVRPYKPAWPHEKIIAAMEEETRKGWRDPELMAVFLDILHKRPEDLLLPENSVDLGAQIFADIMATGTLSWNKKRKSNG
jgi:putative two-component system response regulator